MHMDFSGGDVCHFEVLVEELGFARSVVLGSCVCRTEAWMMFFIELSRS